MKNKEPYKYSALDVAYLVIKEYNYKNILIRNLALNKILYYIQIYNLKKYNYPAFEEEIEAWRHGPVIREIYQLFRKYISSNIEINDKVFIDIKLNISEDILNSINYILNLSMKYNNDWDLVRKTQDTIPWKLCYISNETNIISKDILKEYGIINI